MNVYIHRNTYIYIYTYEYIFIILSLVLGKVQRPHCDLTGIMVNKENHPQMALVQVSELLKYIYIHIYQVLLTSGIQLHRMDFETSLYPSRRRWNMDIEIIASKLNGNMFV